METLFASKSFSRRRAIGASLNALGRVVAIVAAGAMVVNSAALAARADGPADAARFLERSQRALVQARQRHAQTPANADSGVQLAKTCFDRAEFSTADTERAALAVEGINVCRQISERNSTNAAAHLFLALNLGQLARTKTLGALRLVGEMEREFKRAIDLDATVEHAAPERYLGQLYQEAPGWPTSIGSRSRARQHLLRAGELSPDFPENRLCLLEALMEWNDRKSLAKEAVAYREQLPASRGKFAGENWEAAWADWNRRWEKIAAFLAKLDGKK